MLSLFSTKFSVFQLSSFNSMSHHLSPAQHLPSSTQYLWQPILCDLGTPEIWKCQLFHPGTGCPGVQNLHPFKTSFSTHCYCLEFAALTLSSSWQQKSLKNPEVSKPGFVLKTICQNPLSKWFSHLLFFHHAQFHCSKTCKEYESCFCEDTWSQVFHPPCNYRNFKK